MREKGGEEDVVREGVRTKEKERQTFIGSRKSLIHCHSSIVPLSWVFVCIYVRGRGRERGEEREGSQGSGVEGGQQSRRGWGGGCWEGEGPAPP